MDVLPSVQKRRSCWCFWFPGTAHPLQGHHGSLHSAAETGTQDVKGPPAKLRSHPKLNTRVQCCLCRGSLSRPSISQAEKWACSMAADRMKWQAESWRSCTSLFLCLFRTHVMGDLYHYNQKLRTHQDAPLRPHIFQTDAISWTAAAIRKERPWYRVRDVHPELVFLYAWSTICMYLWKKINIFFLFWIPWWGWINKLL